MKVYRVKNWGEHYENNRTRDMKDMRWVPFPNSHDGDGYCQMVEGENGAAILGAWVACVQVASKCQPRGTLMRSSRTPHDATSLARITRLSSNHIHMMMERAVSESIQWMEVVEINDVTNSPAEIPHTPAEIPQEPARNGREGNGREGIEVKGKGGGNATPNFLPSDVQRVLEAYPLKKALAGARYDVECALVEINGRGTPNPVQWLVDRVRLFAESDEGKATTKNPKWWFNDKRYDDDPATWADNKKAEPENGHPDRPKFKDPSIEDLIRDGTVKPEDADRVRQQWRELNAKRNAGKS